MAPDPYRYLHVAHDFFADQKIAQRVSHYFELSREAHETLASFESSAIMDLHVSDISEPLSKGDLHKATEMNWHRFLHQILLPRSISGLRYTDTLFAIKYGTPDTLDSILRAAKDIKTVINFLVRLEARKCPDMLLVLEKYDDKKLIRNLDSLSSK